MVTANSRLPDGAKEAFLKNSKAGTRMQYVHSVQSALTTVKTE